MSKFIDAVESRLTGQQVPDFFAPLDVVRCSFDRNPSRSLHKVVFQVTWRREGMCHRNRLGSLHATFKKDLCVAIYGDLHRLLTELRVALLKRDAEEMEQIIDLIEKEITGA